MRILFAIALITVSCSGNEPSPSESGSKNGTADYEVIRLIKNITDHPVEKLALPLDFRFDSLSVRVSESNGQNWIKFDSPLRQLDVPHNQVAFWSTDSSKWISEDRNNCHPDSIIFPAGQIIWGGISNYNPQDGVHRWILWKFQ